MERKTYTGKVQFGLIGMSFDIFRIKEELRRELEEKIYKELYETLRKEIYKELHETLREELYKEIYEKIRRENDWEKLDTVQN